jgi:adenosine deaminase
LKRITEFVRKLPKAELHLHIEGTLEPAMLVRLAEKHRIKLPYQSVDDVLRAYDFEDLQSFLDLYYLGAGVLQDDEDFHDLMFAYLERCKEEGIVHAEIMFDPQTHTDRGIPFATVLSGFLAAMDTARMEWDMSVSLIMCFLRHLTEESALQTLSEAEPYREYIQSVGLDSSELGHPPEKFQQAFAKAAEQGYRLVAHAGEEGPPAYIHSALDVLKVSRIDHGVRCLEDDSLVERLVADQIPVTVCPLSNVKLCVYDRLEDHPILAMLDRGLNVCINSDDPPYFGGYLLDNFVALRDSLSMSKHQAMQLAANSIRSSFADEDRKQKWLAQISSPYNWSP